MEQNGKEGTVSGPQKILRRLNENSDSLHIARIPKKIKKEFIALTDIECVGDYGWMIDKLMVNYNAAQDMGELIFAIQQLESRIIKLENSGVGEEEPKKQIKMLGKKIESGEKK